MLEPVGTAPGLVVPPASGEGPTVVVLPGPPRELQPMWEDARGTEAFRAAVAGATEYRQRILRLFGIPESEIAATLRVIEEEGVPIDRLEITTCLRRGEIEIATRWEPADEDVYARLRATHPRAPRPVLFSDDGSTIDEQVAGPASRAAGAHRGGGGVVHRRPDGRAPDRPRRVLGVRAGRASRPTPTRPSATSSGCPAELIERHGAVSPEVAAALADGAIARFGADVGIGITGIAGPGGGTEEKPVGWVCFCVAERERSGTGGARIERAVQLPGSRQDIRDRSTTVTMHLLRRLLRGEDGGLEPDPGAERAPA